MVIYLVDENMFNNRKHVKLKPRYSGILHHSDEFDSVYGHAFVEDPEEPQAVDIVAKGRLQIERLGVGGHNRGDMKKIDSYRTKQYPDWGRVGGQMGNEVSKIMYSKESKIH